MVCLDDTLLAYFIPLYRSHTQNTHKYTRIHIRATYTLSYCFLSLIHSLILSLFLIRRIRKRSHTYARTFHGRIINKDIRDVKRTSSSKSDIVLFDLNAALVLDAIHFCSLRPHPPPPHTSICPHIRAGSYTFLDFLIFFRSLKNHAACR